MHLESGSDFDSFVIPKPSRYLHFRAVITIEIVFGIMRYLPSVGMKILEQLIVGYFHQ